jgi:hypothetical protein
MKRELLEKYIGKRVEITLFDNAKYIGTIVKGNGSFYTDKDYYLVGAHLIFKCSHIKKVLEK